MKQVLFSTMLVACLTSATASEPGSYRNIPLWETGQIPGAQGAGPLDAPFITVFAPRAGQANGSAVVIAPGGGNIMLMYGAEGADVAEVFNDWGVTAFVLTYRLSPRYDNDARTRDGERAMRLVRAHAAEWELDPRRVGFIGFSAGGSLARAVTASADAGDAGSSDAVERMSSRPDWAGLIYGAGRSSDGESLQDYPPVFLLSAAGDQNPSLANAQLFMDLTKAGAVAELHVYQRGRHGFGSAVGSSEFADWMPRLQGFLRVNGFLPAAQRPKTDAVVRGKPAPAPRSVNDGHGDYVYVPAGTFKMGDVTHEGWARERPAHVVDLAAYFISKFEVTNREWRGFRDDPGYDDPKFWPNGRVVPRDQIPYWMQPNNHGGGTPGSDDYPVIGVNWDAATAYCAWLSAKTGKRYRLPTEAEWEKAARGTDARRYPFESPDMYPDLANYVGAQAYDTVKPVGSFERGASPYGALDMAGNVMEWTQDWYDRDYYAVSPRKNPQGPAHGSYRVVRGGSFFVEAHDLRTSARSMAWPSFQAHRMIGFRPVREP
ncbi:MAG TPA: SUMF1/EgtB/PvdO family nonheme iron enzyme [Steroidobacteraceae bacterium]|nr:SUMF1/EgtB/PvdO family nonheme iron enzyme [Steroidobacteraceae bacterium]